MQILRTKVTVYEQAEFMHKCYRLKPRKFVHKISVYNRQICARNSLYRVAKFKRKVHCLVSQSLCTKFTDWCRKICAQNLLSSVRKFIHKCYLKSKIRKINAQKFENATSNIVKTHKACYYISFYGFKTSLFCNIDYRFQVTSQSTTNELLQQS